MRVSGCGLVSGRAEGSGRPGAGALRGQDGGGRGGGDMELLPQAQRSLRLAQDAGRLLPRLPLTRLAPCITH